MRITGLVAVTVLFLGASLLFGTALQHVDGMLPTYGAETGYSTDNPPPIDSICLIFAGVDYGGSHSSPQNYVNAKHIVNVIVGSYYFPVVTWETGGSWGSQSLFSYWDDMFKFWSYPDSFTTNNAQDTGRPAVCVDSHGNLHFAWHQLGSPDGYETFYSRAFLDTSAGVIQYNVERPAQFISATNGEEETFPALAIYDDTLLVCVFNVGGIGGEHALNYNYSTDGGTTWAGCATAYEHGGVMPGSWALASIAPDPTSGDMWVAFDYDESGDGSMDIVGFHWDAASNTWTKETIANATSMHPYCLPAIVVDYTGVPHVVFQENFSNTGGAGGLTVYPACGPFGTLFYAHRAGGTWATAMKIGLHPNPYRDYNSGYPSAGLAADNAVYFSTTLPDSATADTSAWGPFNVYYGDISGYGQVAYGGAVSGLPQYDSTNAIYAHITHYVPADGPGITWSQMVNAVYPSDIFYNHSDTLLGIAEDEVSSPSRVVLYQNAPNPFSHKTVIRFSIGHKAEGSLIIYDVAGRMVREWNLHTAYSILPAGIVWDGKDLHGDDVPGGIYLYTLTSGAYSETKKLILVK